LKKKKGHRQTDNRDTINANQGILFTHFFPPPSLKNISHLSTTKESERNGLKESERNAVSSPNRVWAAASAKIKF